MAMEALLQEGGSYTHLLVSSTPSTECHSSHNQVTLFISLFLCIGLVVSYIPQHMRIIIHKTSEGLSPWFLLLGAVSSTSSLLNIVLLQWDTITCCRSLSTFACFESLMGVNQIFLQWAMFSLVFALFVIYFPENKKYILTVSEDQSVDKSSPRNPVLSEEWKVSLMVFVVFAVHFVLSVIISCILLMTVDGPNHWQVDVWAGFLGVFSMLLATFQYLPQIWKTWKRKTVGALSIAMMCLQTPGSALFVYSIAIREGTNWTTWITYLITGILQGCLLCLCIVWHIRNKRLGLSDLDTPTEVDEQEPTENTRLLQTDNA
ncbi:hypothetical protein BDF14DRAFT_1806485 [Spinellus fusiger]|nr:hypothetical protein BDF14DRAFT_1806485 [Spinellus fusiger]